MFYFFSFIMVYEINPKDFRPDIEVSICFLECRDEILLILRGSEEEDKLYAGMWNAAGGKLDNGETPLEAVVREVKEETGLTLPPGKFKHFRSYNMRYPEFDFTNHVFRTRFLEKPITRVETKSHREHIWVTPRRALYRRLVPLESAVIRDIYGVF